MGDLEDIGSARRADTETEPRGPPGMRPAGGRLRCSGRQGLGRVVVRLDRPWCHRAAPLARLGYLCGAQVSMVGEPLSGLPRPQAGTEPPRCGQGWGGGRQAAWGAWFLGGSPLCFRHMRQCGPLWTVDMVFGLRCVLPEELWGAGAPRPLCLLGVRAVCLWMEFGCPEATGASAQTGDAAPTSAVTAGPPGLGVRVSPGRQELGCCAAS